ncbi:IS110 family transposase [Rhizobium mongolense]|uniref:IS110 family transposase n=1 Tax=Rhizobium mongolense TaxID=57676 RepID=UPI0035582EDE
MSKYIVTGSDVPTLLTHFPSCGARQKLGLAEAFRIVSIQGAGLDGFWIHRIFEREGIESFVVDAASIATSRRRRRAKTDKIDGEALIRALLAYKRGEPRVCAMLRAPTPEQEDRPLVRKALTNERIRHVNRVKGLLFSQGVSGYEPLRRDRRKCLRCTCDRGWPAAAASAESANQSRARSHRAVVGADQEVERTRDLMLAASSLSPAPALLLKGIGSEFAAVLWSEGLCRHFDNRRQIAAYAGLAPTPWQSGQIDRDQGVSKSGNPKLRTTLVQVGWLWLRHQPDSALTLWFKERVAQNGGRQKKSTIVALARKLLVALWKYIIAGVVVEGAILTAV